MENEARESRRRDEVQVSINEILKKLLVCHRDCRVYLSLSLSLSLSQCISLPLTRCAQLKSLVGSCGSATQGCRVDLLPAAIECQKLFRHNCCHFVNLPLTARDRDIERERETRTRANKREFFATYRFLYRQTEIRRAKRCVLFYFTFADCSSCSWKSCRLCLFLWLWLWLWHQWRPY